MMMEDGSDRKLVDQAAAAEEATAIAAIAFCRSGSGSYSDSASTTSSSDGNVEMEEAIPSEESQIRSVLAVCTGSKKPATVALSTKQDPVQIYISEIKTKVQTLGGSCDI